ncbi:MAG TPA: hypothetical protein VHD56_16230 [Tepidisphaeraceae bacterium]|nr:hypothetical protein [Tepidisphaeraceae bacterium]
MRYRRSVIAVLSLFAGYFLIRYVVCGRQVGEDSLKGLTMQEVRARYGEPSIAHHDRDEDLWTYYRGLIGGGTGITFENGVVTEAEYHYVK